MIEAVPHDFPVSTGEQSTENQRRELEAVARRRGWEIAAVYEDQGISGANGRDKRPQFDRMLRDAVRGKFDILAAWAVDRLGRSLQELVATLGELRAAGVDLFLHQQAVERRPRVAGRLSCSACSPSLRGR
jgi:DNA invertase Pin-like site-specific DNA recombinase